LGSAVERALSRGGGASRRDSLHSPRGDVRYVTGDDGMLTDLSLCGWDFLQFAPQSLREKSSAGFAVVSEDLDSEQAGVGPEEVEQPPEEASSSDRSS